MPLKFEVNFDGNWSSYYLGIVKKIDVSPFNYLINSRLNDLKFEQHEKNSPNSMFNFLNFYFSLLGLKISIFPT